MNTSGPSSQVSSLPHGGGALHGIGEKFSPDLHTGTWNFSVPISLPPGRNSFQPQVNLVYSTGHGNGPFGLGWNLSLPGVTRKTFKGCLVNSIYMHRGAPGEHESSVAKFYFWGKIQKAGVRNSIQVRLTPRFCQRSCRDVSINMYKPSGVIPEDSEPSDKGG
jgi:hypothetical protein